MTRRYEKTDYPTIEKWYVDWKMPITPEDELPKVGFINANACAFVLETNSKTCFIDSLISTYDYNERRSKDIDLICKKCIEYAVERGFKKIVAMTVSKSVMSRAHSKYEFKWLGSYELLGKEI